MAILVTAILGIAAGNVFCVYMMHKLSGEYYTAMASFVGNAKKQYPAIGEEEWIRFLNEEEGYGEGSRLLNQYGIFREDAVSIKQQRLQNGLLVGVNLFFLFISAGMAAAILVYLYKRQEKLDDLAYYVQKVEQGSYTLDMPDNEEGEISALKNELYKVTVMLKESARLATSQKKALADSMADISHQLKTPLTSVMVLLDNLTESEHMEEDTRKRFLKEIIRQLTKVNWLVATLLKLSRLDAGVVEFVDKPFLLDTLLEEVLGNLELMAEWKQVAFRREGDRGIKMTGDALWIGEALSNIIKNGIEHSPEKATLLISTAENAVYTSVTVTDYGHGMDAEEQKHIFERFYRSQNADKGSVGIGLSLAKAIIEQQNGTVSVTSTLGEGTTFLIKFLKA